MTTNTDGHIEFLRGEEHRALGLGFNIAGKGLGDAATALERQQADLEALAVAAEWALNASVRDVSKRGGVSSWGESEEAATALEEALAHPNVVTLLEEKRRHET